MKKLILIISLGLVVLGGAHAVGSESTQICKELREEFLEHESWKDDHKELAAGNPSMEMEQMVNQKHAVGSLIKRMHRVYEIGEINGSQKILLAANRFLLAVDRGQINDTDFYRFVKKAVPFLVDTLEDFIEITEEENDCSMLGSAQQAPQQRPRITATMRPKALN